jgi:small-conductance mechanosensitive channel
MREDNYLTEASIDLIHTLVRAVTIGLYLMAVLISSIFLPAGLREPFIYLSDYVFLFNGFVVLSFFTIIALVSSAAIEHYRLGDAAKDKDAVIKPGILEFYELFIKYGMILLGLFIALLVGLITIPEGEVRDTVIAFLGSDNLDTAALGANFLSLLIILLSIFLLSKFVEIILDDFKRRSKKIQPGIIDVLKAAIRYSLYWIAIVVTLTIILEMVNFSQIELVVVFIIALTISIIIIIGVSPATRNAVCGIILLLTDSINRGDWVRIGNENTGEVITQGLVITSLKTRTGDIIELPNELILKSYIHNYTKLGGTMVRLALVLRTELPPERVEELILGAARDLDESTQITSERAVLSVAITNLKADSVEYTVGIWRKDPVTTEPTVSTFLKRFHTIAIQNRITVLDTHINRN